MPFLCSCWVHQKKVAKKMTRRHFALVLVSAVIMFAAASYAQLAAGYYTLHYEPHSHEYNVQPGLHKQEPHAVAWGYYEDAINQTGWATLDISSNQKSTDFVQAYSAGYLEGYLTADLIQAYWYDHLRQSRHTKSDAEIKHLLNIF